MTSYVGCPNCRVKYPVKKLYSQAHDRPAHGRSYTVVCAVCGHQFDITFRKPWVLPLPLRAIISDRSRESSDKGGPEPAQGG